MAFYVLDENNNKVEALDKEGVVAAIAQAIEDGSISNLVADAGFISKIKCCISGETLRMAFVTQAYMNTLLQENAADDNTIYYIIDDTSADDLDTYLTNLSNELNDNIANLTTEIENIKSGETVLAVSNALTVNDLEIKKDDSGILGIGVERIPYKKILAIGTTEITAQAQEQTITLSENIAVGDVIEICFRGGTGENVSHKNFFKFQVNDITGNVGVYMYLINGNGVFYMPLWCTSENTIKFSRGGMLGGDSFIYYTVHSISKIVE